MTTILIVDFWDATPHLETSLAIAKTLVTHNTKIEYVFAGRSTCFHEDLAYTKPDPRFFIQQYLAGTNINLNLFPVLPRYDELCDSQVPNNINQLLNWKLDDCDLGRSCYCALKELNTCLVPDLSSQDVRSRLKLAASSYLQVYHYFNQIIQESSPCQIITFNGFTLHSHALVAAAARNHCPTLFHERCFDPECFIITPCHINNLDQNLIRAKHLFNHLGPRVYDPDFRQQSVQAYFARLKQLSQRFNRSPTQDACQESQAGFGRRKVTFFSSSDSEIITAGPDNFGYNAWSSQFDAFIDIIHIIKKFQSELELTIRLHPNLLNYSSSDRDRWCNLLSCIDDIRYIPPSSTLDSYSLACDSDIVLTYGSTIGVESLFLNKPTISLAKCSASVFRCLRQVHSTSELERYILDPVTSFLPSWRYYLEDYAIFWLYEGCYNRWKMPLSLDIEVFALN